MSDRQIAPVTKRLLRGREFIADQKNWCAEGEGIVGLRENPDGSQAGCILQALNITFARDTGKHSTIVDTSNCDDPDLVAHTLARNALIEAAGGVPYDIMPVVRVNRQGHEAAMALYDKAIGISIMENAK